MNFKTKCYMVGNEKIFGDIILTRQTLERSYTVDNWLFPTLHIHGNQNLAQQTIETPDFMALNRSMRNSIIKRQKNKLSIENISYKPTKINSINNSTDVKINNQHHHVKDELSKSQKFHPLPVVKESHEEVMVSLLVDQLLSDIYRYPKSDREHSESESTVSSFRPRLRHRYLQQTRLQLKNKDELSLVLETLQNHISHVGGLLIRQLRRRDYLRTKRDRQYDVITAHLQAYSNKRSMDVRE